MTIAEWNAWAAANWPNYALTKLSKTVSNGFMFGAVNALVRYSGAFADAGTMWGSPVASNNRWTYDSSVHRVVQHAVRSVADWQGLKDVGASAVVFFIGLTSAQSSFNPYYSVNRNGFTSASYGSYTVAFTTSFLYYSVELGYPVVGMGDTYARFYPSSPIYLLNGGVWKGTGPFVLAGGAWKSIINVSAKV